MYSPLYKNDDIPTIPLSEDQINEIQKVKDKILSNEYGFTTLTQCPCCNSSHFELLSEKDRYGFHNPNVICQDCGLIFSNPMWTDESVSNFYEHHYGKIYKNYTDTESFIIKIPNHLSRPFRI